MTKPYIFKGDFPRTIDGGTRCRGSITVFESNPTAAREMAQRVAGDEFTLRTMAVDGGQDEPLPGVEPSPLPPLEPETPASVTLMLIPDAIGSLAIVATEA